MDTIDFETRVDASRGVDGDRPGGATSPPGPRPNPNPKSAPAEDVLLLKPAEVAATLRKTPQALANMRYRGQGPKYTKSQPGKGGRVGYRPEDVKAYLDSITVDPANPRAA